MDVVAEISKVVWMNFDGGMSGAKTMLGFSIILLKRRVSAVATISG